MTSRFDGPDQLPPVTLLSEIEARMGLPPLEVLLAERDELVKTTATLRAKHGPFGGYEAQRKIEWCKIATLLRAEALEKSEKMTEAALEQKAHADPRYFDFITRAMQEKADWAVAENRIQGIADTILRANAIARYLAAEAHL
jgi:hypothetical protein